MDFINRSGQPRVNGGTAQPNGEQPKQSAAAAAAGNNSDRRGWKDTGRGKWLNYGALFLLYSVTALILAVLASVAFLHPNRESKIVNKSEMQAVFVNVNGTNGGQVYFGHIRSLTPDYIRLTNVFYIQNQAAQNAQNSSQAYSLVKLGCELHGPEDEMVVNRSQVFFWENLKSSGQVTQKVAEFYKNNPNGQKCSTTGTGTDTTSSQNATTTQTPAANQPSQAPTTTTAPAAPVTTKKP